MRAGKHMKRMRNIGMAWYKVCRGKIVKKKIDPNSHTEIITIYQTGIIGRNGSSHNYMTVISQGMKIVMLGYFSIFFVTSMATIFTRIRMIY